MRHNLVLTSKGRSVIVLTDEDSGDSSLVTDTHINYARIVSALSRGEDVTDLLDGTPPEPAPLEDVIANLSAHVTIVNDVLHFDGDERFDVLSDTIRRYHDEGRDSTNFVRFMERLALNPSENSRDQLFAWTQAKDLTIDPEGFIIAYKGVSQDLLSLTAGNAIVDGTEISGYIPNEVGTVVEMPRGDVDSNVGRGCSTGLHVGSWGYASTFGPVTLEVRLDPADVVSVPSDCGYQKLRCCKYTVVAVHDTSDDDLTDYEPEASMDPDEGMDSFMEFAPEGFVARLRDRLRRKDR